MQTLAHTNVNGGKLLLLCRSEKYGVQLKLRKSGKDGVFLTDEGLFLESQPALLQALLEGKVIKI